MITRKTIAAEQPSIVTIMEVDGIIFSETDPRSGKRDERFLYSSCPLCDDNEKSMVVDTVKNVFRCRSCGEGGSPVGYFRKTLCISFNEAAAYCDSLLREEKT